jgi:hypothetical protein
MVIELIEIVDRKEKAEADSYDQLQAWVWET